MLAPVAPGMAVLRLSCPLPSLRHHHRRGHAPDSRCAFHQRRAGPGQLGLPGGIDAPDGRHAGFRVHRAGRFGRLIDVDALPSGRFARGLFAKPGKHDVEPAVAIEVGNLQGSVGFAFDVGSSLTQT